MTAEKRMERALLIVIGALLLAVMAAVIGIASALAARPAHGQLLWLAASEPAKQKPYRSGVPRRAGITRRAKAPRKPAARAVSPSVAPGDASVRAAEPPDSSPIVPRPVKTIPMPPWKERPAK